MKRRSFVRLIGLGIAAIAFGGYEAFKVGENFSANKVDFHAHAIVPSYVEGLKRLGIDVQEIEGISLPRWTVDEHLKFMVDAGIDFTILSIPTPHIYNGDSKELLACDVARQVNIELSKICSFNPDKFGFAATLPMPSVNGSIDEIEYSISNLGALGVKVASNSDGVYLGDEMLDPIFKELNARHALVIIHPSAAQKLPRTDVVTGKVMELYEYPADTTRAVLNMISNGTLEKFPNIKFVVPHCGSFLPYMKQRANTIFKTLAGENRLDAVDVETELKKFYFDLAGDPMPEEMDILLKITDEDHLIYGSDFPFTPAQILLSKKKILDEELEKRDLTKKIYCDNAKKVLEWV